MRIQSFHPFGLSPVQDKKTQPDFAQRASELTPAKDRPAELQPMSVHNESVERFAEWYLRGAKAYEGIRSYRQAIAAYEKSYAVSPKFPTAVSIDGLRGKILEK